MPLQSPNSLQTEAVSPPIDTIPPGELYSPYVALMALGEAAGLVDCDSKKRIDLLRHATATDMVGVVANVHQAVAPEDDLSPWYGAMYVVARRTSKSPRVVIKRAEPEERLPLFEKAIELGHKLIAQYDESSGSEDNLLERLANLAAFSIVLAHPFKDGNGRTARAMADLICNGFPSSAEQAIQLNMIASSRRPIIAGIKLLAYEPITEPQEEGYTHFLEEVAAVGTAFDSQVYHEQVAGKFTTPYDKK